MEALVWSVRRGLCWTQAARCVSALTFANRNCVQFSHRIHWNWVTSKTPSVRLLTTYSSLSFPTTTPTPNPEWTSKCSTSWFLVASRLLLLWLHDVHPSVSLSVHPHVCLFARLSVCLSVRSFPAYLSKQCYYTLQFPNDSHQNNCKKEYKTKVANKKGMRHHQKDLRGL